MDKSQQLAQLIVSYITSRRDKKAESFYKDKPKRNKQGIVTNGAINIRLESILNRLMPDKKQVIQTIEKSKKDKTQTPLNFQEKKYQQLLTLLPESVTDSDLLALKSELHDFLNGLDDEFNPVAWLTEWTAKARDISFATHVAKLTHSSSKGSGILDTSHDHHDGYLTTSSLHNPDIDTASSNAASLPIADILKLSVNGVSVLDYIKSGDTAFFKHITDDDNLIKTWYENLKQAYDSDQKSSYFLNKQIYFPIDAQGNYHLLLPLVSSSLVHAIYNKHQQYYSEEATYARKQRKDKLYSPLEVRSYPNKAVLHVTGSNHSNASALNGQRGGRIVLFAALPPQWRSNNASVASKTSLFDKQLAYRLKQSIAELKTYLRVLKKQQLSIGKPERNAAVLGKLSAISEDFFSYITEIQMQDHTAGWTRETELPIEQQLLLEPNRDDELAKTTMQNKDWLVTLSRSYARWLNGQLSDKQLKLNKVQAVLWQEHFLHELKKFITSYTAENENIAQEVSV